MWAKYGKTIIAGLFAAWTAFAPLISGDGKIEREEWFIFAAALLNVLLVYFVPLNPAWRWGKTIINAGLASLAAAQTVIVDGLQPDDWTIIIGAGLAILIGWVAPTISMQGTSEQVRVPTGLNA